METVVKLSLVGGGGRYTAGNVGDGNSIIRILRDIESDGMHSCFDYSTGRAYDNRFLLYGLDPSLSFLTISNCSSELIYKGRLCDSGCGIFCSKEPNPIDWIQEANDLYVVNCKAYVHMRYELELTIAGSEEFEISNLYVTFASMEELFNRDISVIDNILYIPKDASCQLAKLYCAEENLETGHSREYLFEDYADSIFGNSDFANEIVSKYGLKKAEHVGHPEWKYDHLRIFETGGNAYPNIIYEKNIS